METQTNVKDIPMSERIEGWAVCTKCHIKKPLNAFYERKDTDLGYHVQCKQCKKAQVTKYYIDNTKAKKEYAKKYQKENQPSLLI